MEIRIRPITARDLEDCGRICYEGFKVVNERHGFPPQFPSIEAAAARVGHMLNARSTFGVVAEAEGSIAGFAFLTERDPVRAIGPVVIDPIVQSHGIGRRLMETLLQRASGASGIRLVQAGFNVQSLALYVRLGFDVKDQLIVITGRPRRAIAKEYSVRRLEEADVPECEVLHKRILDHSRTNELRDQLAKGSALAVFHGDRLAGYLSSPTRVAENHGIADSDEAMQSLLCGAPEFSKDPLSFLLPARHAKLFRWCLGEGLRAEMPMTLMSLGEYSAPQGLYVPSVLY